MPLDENMYFVITQPILTQVVKCSNALLSSNQNIELY